MQMNVISNLAMVFQSWTVLLIIIAAIYTIILVQWKMYKSSRLLAAFGKLPTLPIVGNVHLISGNARTRVQKVLNLLKTLEKPTVIWFSYLPVIFLTKSEDILQTINRNQDRDLLGIFEGILDDGILLAKGEKWRYLRRILNQGFTVPMLNQYLHAFNEQSQVMVKRLEEKANTGVVIDLWQYIIDMNFDVVIENMLGYKIHSRKKKDNEFITAALRVVTLESKRLTNPILFFDVFYKIYLYLSGYDKLYRIVHKLPKEILEEKIGEFKMQKENRCSVEEKPAKTLIGILLKVHDEQPEFDERQIRIEILNMILTGSDTTATTLSFVCLFLAMHPEIQEKVYQEIRVVFKDDFAEVNMEHCSQLKYMEQCIKETLRRFTLVPFTARQCSEPIKLSDEQVIPANFKVGFSYYTVHQNPSVYPDPEKYDPDRFSPENHSQNANHFMGFGVGHRSCIGMKYAMLSMKTQLVHLLRKYRFTTEMQMSDIVHVFDLISRSENGYLVKIWHR